MLLFTSKRKHSLKGYTSIFIVRKRSNKYLGGIVMAAVAAISIASLVMAHAAGNFLALEPENGTTTGNVTVVNDGNASGGKYVMFGTNNSPTPTPFAFVTRSGSQLMLNGKSFRFAGANIYWLGLDENDNGSVSGINFPPHFNVDDALSTAKEMGATVVRSHTLGISSTDSTSNNCPASICLAIGVSNGNIIFNDAAFASIDYAVSKAKADKIYLVVPFTDGNTPCFYEGCIRNFINWVDPALPNSAFFTDSRVINYFEQYVSHLLNHVNQYTGIAMKDEPTIIGWESGNEMDDTSTNATWLSTVSKYVKSIDTKHFFIDGGWTMDSARLNIATIDMYTRHHYQGGYYGTGAITDDNYYGCQADTYNKAYFAGEYDWTEHTSSPLTLSSYLPHVENDLCSNGHHVMVGDLYWSLFPHRDTYGFETHGDGYTLHYTGDARFTTAPDMWTQVQKLRNHAFAMQGQTVPASTVPAPPTNLKLTNTANSVSIKWTGSVAADSYQIQRSTDNATWKIVNSTKIDDSNTPWTDTGVSSGVTYYYRVQAVNRDGAGGAYSTSFNISH